VSDEYDDADDPTDGQPVFVPAELDNMTVVEGQTATLLCRVYGDLSTRLQVFHSVCRRHVVTLPGVLLLLVAFVWVKEGRERRLQNFGLF